MERFAEQNVCAEGKPSHKLPYILSWCGIVLFGAFALTRIPLLIGAREDGSSTLNIAAAALLLLCCAACVFLWRVKGRSFVEYDYIFEDGSFIVDAVYSRRERKNLLKVECAQITSFEAAASVDDAKAKRWYLHDGQKLSLMKWNSEGKESAAYMELDDELEKLIAFELRRVSIRK